MRSVSRNLTLWIGWSKVPYLICQSSPCSKKVLQMWRCGRRGGLMVSALDSGASGSGSGEPWPGTLCCVLGQDTLLSPCHSPPRSINGYHQIVGENLTNLREVTCDGLASRPGEVEILLAASCYRNRDKLRQLWVSLGSKASLLNVRHEI